MLSPVARRLNFTPHGPRICLIAFSNRYLLALSVTSQEIEASSVRLASLI